MDTHTHTYMMGRIKRNVKFWSWEIVSKFQIKLYHIAILIELKFILDETSWICVTKGHTNKRNICIWCFKQSNSHFMQQKEIFIWLTWNIFSYAFYQKPIWLQMNDFWVKDQRIIYTKYQYIYIDMWDRQRQIGADIDR